MALSNAELAAQTSGGAAPKDEQKVDGSIAFKRNLFLNTENTGIGVDRKKGTPNGEVKELVKFDPELQKQYAQFLDGYVQNLNRVSKDFPAILQKKNHATDLLLVQTLSEGGRSSDDKINAFLQTPEGWMVTTQLMEEQMARKLFALGLNASVNPDAERTNIIDSTKIITRIDEGAVRGFVRDNIEPYYGKIAKVTGIALSSALGAGVVGKFIDAGLAPHGAVAGALTPIVVKAIMSYRNEGLTIDVNQSAAALEVIKNDRDEAKFVKIMNGIDVDNYEVDGSGIKTVDSRVQTNLNTQQVWQDILSTIYTRANFYESLGIPLKEIDAIPEQFLFNMSESNGQMEQTGSRWDQRLWEKFDANKKGIKDRAGNPISDPSYVPVDIDRTGSIKRFEKARKEVMLETMQEYLARTLSREVPSSTDIDVLTRRIDTISTDGAEFKKQSEKKDEEIAGLQKESDSYNPLQERVQVYEDARNALQEAYQRVDRELPEHRGKTIDQIEKELLSLKYDETNPSSIPALENGLNASIYTAILSADAATDTYIAATYPTKQPPPDVLRKIYESRRTLLTGPLENQLNHLKEVKEKNIDEQLQKVKAIREEIKKNEDITRRAAAEALMITTEKVKDFTNDYSEITGWVAIGTAPNITENDLIHKSRAEIMTMINELKSAGSPDGWALGDNSSPANIAKVDHAIAEAKARAIENFDLSPQHSRDIYQEIIIGSRRGVVVGAMGPVVAITPEELVGSNNDDLLNKLHTEYGWSAAPADAEANMRDLEAARAEARRKLLLRVGTLVIDKTTILEQQIETKKKEKADIKFDKEISFLKFSRSAMNRKGEIYSQTLEQMYKPDTFLNLNLVTTTTEGYTLAEATTGAPEGYYNIAQMLFQYQDETNREKAFNSVLQILPPDRLALWLDDALDIKVGRGGITPTIDAVLNKIQTLSKRNQMPPHRLYMGMNEVLRNIRNQAMAYTV